jgi:hypothetical protein
MIAGLARLSAERRIFRMDGIAMRERAATAHLYRGNLA